MKVFMKQKTKNLVGIALIGQIAVLAACGRFEAKLDGSAALSGAPPVHMTQEDSGVNVDQIVEEQAPHVAQEPLVPSDPEQSPAPTQPPEQAQPEVQQPSPAVPSIPTVTSPSPAPVKVPFRPSTNEVGVLKPTVYYFAVINEDKNPCKDTEKTTLHGAGGVRLLTVCSKTEKTCGLQGSCAVVQSGRTYMYNIITRINGQDRFFEIKSDGCRFGYGVKSSCLDPFYTLAADLSIYKPGEVIFVPAVVGLALPDGTKHSGYFVIRDQGRGIKGHGRFDFYSGFMSWMDPKNPFTKIGLGSVNTNIPYLRVKGELAQKVLVSRAYPKVPPNANGGPIK